MLKVKCTECKRQYRVADDYAGRKIRCKNCKTVIVIPKQEEHDCDDSVARLNSLLRELEEYERTAPIIEVESKR